MAEVHDLGSGGSDHHAMSTIFEINTGGEFCLPSKAYCAPLLQDPSETDTLRFLHGGPPACRLPTAERVASGAMSTCDICDASSCFLLVSHCAGTALQRGNTLRVSWLERLPRKSAVNLKEGNPHGLNDETLERFPCHQHLKKTSIVDLSA